MGDGTGCDNMTAIIVQFRGADARSGAFKRPASVVDPINSHSSVDDGSSSSAAAQSDAKRPRTEEPTQAPIVDTSS